MVAAPKLDRITVREAVDRYLVSVQRAVRGHSLALTTATNYSRDLEEFVNLAGPDTILDDLSGPDIDDIVLEYGSKPDSRYKPRPGVEPKLRGPGSQARFRQSVSRLFSEATLSGWVEASPMPRTVVKPKGRSMSNVARKALTQESATALLDAVLSSPAPARVDQDLALRDTFLLRLLVEGGPRVSEVCNADRADLERRPDGTHWLRVLGKGNKERWVPVSQGTADAYQEYVTHERPAPKPRTRKDPETGEKVETVSVDDAERALLLTWRGLRMRPRDVQLLTQRACNRLPAQVRRQVTPHGLRHTAATLLLASGAADVKTVKELLGHESLAVTGVYLDTVAAELSAAVAAHPVTGEQ